MWKFILKRAHLKCPNAERRAAQYMTCLPCSTVQYSTVQDSPIYGLSALQYKQHFSCKISRFHARELCTQGTVSGVSVFLDSSSVDTIIIVM